MEKGRGREGASVVVYLSAYVRVGIEDTSMRTGIFGTYVPHIILFEVFYSNGTPLLYVSIM